MEFVFDTGSDDLWVPGKDCSTCPNEDKFKMDESTTFVDLKTTVEINYLKGYVKGTLAIDKVGVSKNSQVELEFLNIKSSRDMEGMQCDGIIGLGRSSNARSIVRQMDSQDVIDKAEFTVYIGKSGFDQSYIEFGSRPEDSEVVWIDCYETGHWSVPLDNTVMRVGDDII